MARTAPTKVREELDVTASEYSDNEADVDIQRANYIINDRIAGRYDDTTANDELLTDIETLVAAHIASEQFSDSVQDGRALSSISQGSAQLSYQNDEGVATTGPGGFASTYWNQALALDMSGRLGVRTSGVTVSITDSEETN